MDDSEQCIPVKEVSEELLAEIDFDLDGSNSDDCNSESELSSCRTLTSI
jgi:hypothetical protein